MRCRVERRSKTCKNRDDVMQGNDLHDEMTLTAFHRVRRLHKEPRFATPEHA